VIALTWQPSGAIEGVPVSDLGDVALGSDQDLQTAHWHRETVAEALRAAPAAGRVGRRGRRSGGTIWHLRRRAFEGRHDNGAPCSLPLRANIVGEDDFCSPGL
jgi:hypothetical protein